MSKEKRYQNEGQLFIEKQFSAFNGKAIHIYNEEFNTSYDYILQEQNVTPIIGGHTGNPLYETLKAKHQIVGLREKIFEINQHDIESLVKANKHLTVSEVTETIFQDFVKKFNNTTNEAQQYQLIFTHNEQIKDKNKRVVEFSGIKEVFFYNVVYYEKTGKYSNRNSFYTIRERRIPIFNHPSKNSERPDFVHYINGIPLVLVEYKTEDSGILQALKDFEFKESYQRIPFKIALNDGKDVLFFSSIELLKVPQKKDTSFRWVHYLPEKRFIGSREYLNIEYLFEELLCQPENMYNYCVNACTLVNNDNNHYLINARIQQYYAIKDISRTLVNGSDGLMSLPYNFEFAHAQRSGKTITMKLITYLIQRDFSDLFNTVFMYAPDLQIKDVITNEFSRSGNSKISLKIVESRSEYQNIIDELHQAEQSGTTHFGMKIFVVNMQKISEEEFQKTDTKKIIKSNKILNIIDEAHHGQTKETATIENRIFPNASNYLFTATGKSDMYLYYFPDNIKDGFCNKFTISNAKSCDITVPVLFMQAEIKPFLDNRIEQFSKKAEDLLFEQYKKSPALIGQSFDDDEASQFIDAANREVTKHIRDDLRSNSFDEKLDFLVNQFNSLSYNLAFKPKFIIYCNSVNDAKKYIETIQSLNGHKSEKNFYKGYRFGTDFSSIQDVCEIYNPGITDSENISTNFEKLRTSTDTENDSGLIIDALFAVDKYQKGFDLPALLATFLDTNIAEPARLNQIYTRAATKAPGKTVGYCIDMAFESKNKDTYQHSIMLYDNADIEGGFIDEDMLQSLKEILEQEFQKLRKSLDLEPQNFSSNMVLQQLLNEPDLKLREKRQTIFFNTSRNIISNMTKVGSPLLFRPFKEELKVLYEAFDEFKKIYADKQHNDYHKILINMDRTAGETDFYITEEEIKTVINEVLHFLNIHNIKNLINFDYSGKVNEITISEDSRDEVRVRFAQELNKNNLETAFNDLGDFLKNNHTELFELIKHMLSRISNDRSIIYQEMVQNEISDIHTEIENVKKKIQEDIQSNYEGDHLLYWMAKGIKHKLKEYNVSDDAFPSYLAKEMAKNIRQVLLDVPRHLPLHEKTDFILNALNSKNRLGAFSSYIQTYRDYSTTGFKELLGKMKEATKYKNEAIAGNREFFTEMIANGINSYYKNT